MKKLLLAVLIAWGCAEGALRQAEQTAKTTADATEEKTGCLSQAPEEGQEVWTVAPPTRGEPKVPGPPYPYLNDDSRCGLFDKLRKFRWLVWEYEQAVIVERSYLDKWLEWERNFSQEQRDNFRHIHNRSIKNTNVPICGNWGGDWEKIPHSGQVWHSTTPGYEGLRELITQYAILHPTAGTRTVLSFENEVLVRSYGGEAVSSWLAKLETVVEEIAELERSNGAVARQIEERVLGGIDGCTADMTLNLCPHPTMAWNIDGGHCSNPP